MRAPKPNRLLKCLVLAFLSFNIVGCTIDALVQLLFIAAILGSASPGSLGGGGQQNQGPSPITIAVVDLSASTPEDTPTTILVLQDSPEIAAILASLTVTIVAPPAHGTATVDNTTKAVVYTPDPNFNGSDSFAFQACDNQTPPVCGSAAVVITVTPANDPPSASDDAAAVAEDALPNTATGNILANDTDVDTGNTLTVSAVAASAANVGAPVTGIFGALTVAADGNFTYTLDNSNPAVQALGAADTVTDVFAYTATDGTAADDAALTITITGADETLSAVDDANSVTEDATPNTAIGSVLTNDIGLTSVTEVNGSAANVGVAVAGTFGSVTVNADGTYTYTLDNSNTTVDALNDGETLTDTFNYTASDGVATATAALTVTITGATDPPP